LIFPPNKLIAIYGSQGSGKTVLLRSIAGLNDKRSSFQSLRVFLNNRPIDTIPKKLVRTEITYVDASMIEAVGSLRVGEATKVLSDLSVRDLAKSAFEMINLLDLHPLLEKPQMPLCTTPSSQRTAFLALLALVKPAKVLLFDGIFDHVDDEKLNRLVEMLRSSKSKRVVLVSTRHERRFLHSADFFVALKDGKIVFEGDPRDYVMRTH